MFYFFLTGILFLIVIYFDLKGIANHIVEANNMVVRKKVYKEDLKVWNVAAIIFTLAIFQFTTYAFWENIVRPIVNSEKEIDMAIQSISSIISFIVIYFQKSIWIRYSTEYEYRRRSLGYHVMPGAEAVWLGSMGMIMSTTLLNFLFWLIVVQNYRGLGLGIPLAPMFSFIYSSFVLMCLPIYFYIIDRHYIKKNALYEYDYKIWVKYFVK